MKNQFQIIQAFFPNAKEVTIEPIVGGLINTCLLYTSDAADE